LPLRGLLPIASWVAGRGIMVRASCPARAYHIPAAAAKCAPQRQPRSGAAAIGEAVGVVLNRVDFTLARNDATIAAGPT
jgi:hypothetical protein